MLKQTTFRMDVISPDRLLNFPDFYRNSQVSRYTTQVNYSSIWRDALTHYEGNVMNSLPCMVEMVTITQPSQDSNVSITKYKLRPLCSVARSVAN